MSHFRKLLLGVFILAFSTNAFCALGGSMQLRDTHEHFSKARDKGGAGDVLPGVTNQHLGQIGAYEEEVKIPSYDENNSTHVLITESNGNWNSTVLNDSGKKHFYIAPGYYDTRINLTASGTEEDRRTLSLYNGNDEHPASLPDSQVANVWFHLVDASYWIIDRMANLDRNVNPSMRLQRSSHNIINRWHGRNMKYGLTIYPFSDFNTVQNSYFNQATSEGIITDCIGLALANANTQDTVTRGTKVINNDFRNMTDGIQLIKSTYIANGNPSYPGTIIYDNRIWMDEDSYSDGNYAEDGFSHDPDSPYMLGENAMDFKAASNEPDAPVLVKSNIMWGYRQADDTTPTNAGGAGTAISITRHSYNLKIDSNIIFDSQNGIGATHLYYEGTEFINNILYDIGRLNPPTSAYPQGRNPYALYISASPDMQAPFLVKYNNNTFVRQHLNAVTGGGRTVSVHQNAAGSFLENNLFIDTQKMGGRIGNHTRKNNWYYNHTGATLGGEGEVMYATAEEGRMTDYAFVYERFTGKPKQKILKGVITTKDSPHYGIAGSSIPKYSENALFDDSFE